MVSPSKRQDAVDMGAAQAEVITDLLLRKLQVVSRWRDQSAAPESVVKVDQHGGNPFGRFQARDASDQLLGTPAGLDKERRKTQGNLAVFH